MQRKSLLISTQRPLGIVLCEQCWVCTTAITPKGLVIMRLWSVVRTRKTILSFHIADLTLANPRSVPVTGQAWARHCHTRRHTGLSQQPCEVCNCAQCLRGPAWPAWSHRGKIMKLNFYPRSDGRCGALSHRPCRRGASNSASVWTCFWTMWAVTARESLSPDHWAAKMYSTVCVQYF